MGLAAYITAISTIVALAKAGTDGVWHYGGGSGARLGRLWIA